MVETLNALQIALRIHKNYNIVHDILDNLEKCAKILAIPEVSPVGVHKAYRVNEGDIELIKKEVEKLNKKNRLHFDIFEWRIILEKKYPETINASDNFDDFTEY